MKLIFWFLFIVLSIFSIFFSFRYLIQQLILKGSILILKLIIIWSFILKFLISDHRLWYRLFAQSIDFEFFDFQTQKWFFKWLNWNLVNLEFIVLYIQVFRISYLYFWLILYYIKYYFSFIKNNWNKWFFFSIIQQNFWIFWFFFLLKFNINFLFSTSLLVKTWILFLWWRTYFFIMTRLDFNFFLWSYFKEETIRGQIRGFKLGAVNYLYFFSLYFLRPVFFSNNNFNTFLSIWTKVPYLIFQTISIYIYQFLWKINCFNIEIYIFLLNETLIRKYIFILKQKFIYLFNKIWIYLKNIRYFCFKFVYFLSLFCLLSLSFFLTIFWHFLYFIYKIRKYILFTFFIVFFGLFFWYEIFSWLIPTWNRIHSLFNSTPTSYLMNFSDRFMGWDLTNEWFIRTCLPRPVSHKKCYYGYSYYWPIWDYDYLLMSLKRIGEMETDEGEPIEDWQQMMVWLESFKWTPMGRNLEDPLQLWSEGIKLKKYKKKFHLLFTYYLLNYQDSINWLRIFNVKFYPYDSAATWYRRVVLWKWWSYIFWKRAKWKRKKWYRMVGRLRNFTRVKYKLFWRLLVTPDWYNVWIWLVRLKFYVPIALFDSHFCFWFFFGIYSFISWYYIKIFIIFLKNYLKLIIKILIIIKILLLKFLLFNFYNLLYKLKFFIFKLCINNSWYLLYIYLTPFLPKLEYRQIIFENNLFFIYFLFYSEKLYNYLLTSWDFLFYGYTYRPVWGNWLKTIFTNRDYIKSFFDIFYLEYDSLVHRRYTYRAYYLNSIVHQTYTLKRRRARRHRRGGGGTMRPRLLKRVGLGRFLFIPNSLVSEHFGRILGLAYNSKLYWKCKRFSLRLTWFIRSYKLFRTIDYLIICIWAWIIFCLFFFVGFRYFFHYKLINDFNGWFYWHKLRKQPIEDLSILFKKLDRQLIRSKLHNAVKNLEFSSGVWMVDFKSEILYGTSSQNMKQFYKESLKSILNKPNSFKWRLRTLKNNVIKNWDKVEFFFFDKSTENYFETWITYSTLLSIVMFELMLITSNKDIYGLSLNTIDDEDIQENVESAKALIRCGNKLVNTLFLYLSWIDKVLFKYELPEWIWHKDGFLDYQKFYPLTKHSSTISFDEHVIGVIRPILVWGLFIPCLFFFSFRNLLKRKKWKNMKWGHMFFKITFWYHFDLYGEAIKFLMRAYFNAQCYAMYRGKFTGKSFVIMRRRKKLKTHRRFIWHYLNTCYAELAFIRIFVRRSSNIGIIFLHRGTLGQFLNWFNIFWWVSFISCIILYLKLVKYSLKYFTNFRSQLKTMKSFREFVVYWMYVEIYLHQKIILRNWCKKYGFNN